MKYAALIFVLLLVPSTRATPGPNDYPVTIHVSACHLNLNSIEVNAVINGKKYILIGPYYGVLALGDYQAKLIKDEHKTSYDAVQTYEFLFPDNKTRRYEVVGQSE